MRLTELLQGLVIREVCGASDPDITSVTHDSRAVARGSLYVAIRGITVDGHQYLLDVERKGASAAVVEQIPPAPSANVTYVVVPDSAEAAGQIASAFNGHPSKRMRIVGVTGTNGKTTTATLLHAIASAQGLKAGLLSTIKNLIVNEPIRATHTTPDSINLQTLLGRMVAKGCSAAFMEVSSHSVVQRRIAGISFAGGIFTNLTHDHLDYHGTMESYFQAKERFFRDLPREAFALANIDDPHGSRILAGTSAAPLTFGLNERADYSCEITSNDLDGLGLLINGMPIETQLVGRFNAYNIVAAFAASERLNFEATTTARALASMAPVDGRFDWVRGRQDRVGIVDFAHTPDGLSNLLHAARDVLPNRRVVLVIGCGGDRDSEKRPIMGSLAATADISIFTSDNPRSEDPLAIINAMKSGVPVERREFVEVEIDRAKAIARACEIAGAGGVVIVAGKGHERSQEIGHTRIPFYDKEKLISGLQATKH